MAAKPPFTMGIEEEYHLVNIETREAAAPPDALFTECEQKLGDHVGHEFMASQIEIGTPVCASPAEAREQLVHMRSTVAEVAEKYGFAPIAAATHPISRWQEARHTDDTRYNDIANDLQTVVRRLLISGMHVHVGLGDDDELRMDLMNQVTYFLPHLLALSTSSPFWQKNDTGLASYRLSIFTELPRTGLPEPFETFVDYQRHVDVLVQAGILQDATKIWWDLRPSDRYPTLEMRICDVCTDVDDAVAIGALFVCILRMLYRLKGSNQRWRRYSNMLVAENRWRAQRYGIDEPLIDFGKGELVPVPDLVEELLDLTAEDAAEAGCEKEIGHVRTILNRGTSAHLQRNAYQAAIDGGADQDTALRAVVDMLIKTTRPDPV
ncbi:MAG: carboxylate-amine ligase [Rhodospirillales bacterium]|jgi:glutamate---cysteine ligase / carboxylate-amine ligase|nr:carboxylate-amine ligase [Rhodospirillales bacterium]MBT4040178.1 carboxylate-amine ligase [Rhodospirillales bacterium]MBT4628546.1 carboxylate-amine ligase [Rhodospirillales bacterium]MBT5352674.1 carboxylate-amine ligase [Rhodospirillales bacterium]MBT5521690.1 carboxylate-amine ligase [Rhodospirillales bacterium]